MASMSAISTSRKAKSREVLFSYTGPPEISVSENAVSQALAD